MTLRRIVRIARWEISTSTGAVDRRTVGIVLVVLLLGAGGAVAGGAGGGGVVDNEIYRVGIEDTHPYAPAVDAHGPLRAVSPDSAAEIHVRGDTIDVGEGDQNQAAYAELRTGIQRYNQLLLRDEPDEAAAFPVIVEVQFVETQDQSIVEQAATAPPPASEETTPPDGPDDEPDDSPPPTDDEADPAGESTADPEQTQRPTAPALDETLLPRTTSVGTPADITPPFPFASLVLAFLFLVPLNFVIQAYGSTILDERINRRGELLLAAPVTASDIVLGKTVPYFLAATVVLIGIAGLLRVGVLGTIGVFALAALFLAATFVSALFARSYQELTFLTVAISVLGTAYAFVPAVFTEVTPVALISPLTLVVFDLEGQSVSAVEGLVSVAPAVTTAGVLFWLGVGTYRAETLFSQRPPQRKLLSMLAVQVSRRRDVALVTVALLPIVLLLQLFALAVLFVVPSAVAVPVMLVVVSIIEETAKSVHVFAGYEHDRFDRSLRSTAELGGVSGGAFFLGETAVQLLQLAGLTNIELGRTVVTPVSLEAPTAIALLAAPLLLHVVTAVIAATGASRGRRFYLIGLVAAVGLHTLYNAVVITLVG